MWAGSSLGYSLRTLSSYLLVPLIAVLCGIQNQMALLSLILAQKQLTSDQVNLAKTANNSRSCQWVTDLVHIQIHTNSINTDENVSWNMRRNHEDYSPSIAKELFAKWNCLEKKTTKHLILSCLHTFRFPLIVRIDFERYIHLSLFLSH